MLILQKIRRCLRLLLPFVSVLLVSGCASLPAASEQGVKQEPQRAAENSWLGTSFVAATAGHAPASGFHLFSAGIDGLLLRLELIDKAQESVDLQYYIFRCDDTGRLIQQAVLRAADRGVHVRIITDDGETVRGDEQLLQLAAHPSIQVRVFNPFHYRGHNKALRAMDFLFHKSRLDYRMHNKLMVVDGMVAVTGGRNIGDRNCLADCGGGRRTLGWPWCVWNLWAAHRQYIYGR